MEEEIMRSLSRKANPNQTGGPPASSANIPMTKKFHPPGNDAKTMSFDENFSPSSYGSPMSSILSQSPGTAWGTSGAHGRRDSLKNLWHLQDFGTD